MQETDILIIGGGAAGMMAASLLSESKYDVTILEKNRDFGTKLLITGKGRCNITNMREWKDFAEHIHPDPKFFKTAFYEFSNETLVRYLEDAGLKTKVERGMRVFPESDRSHDVRDALKNTFRNKVRTHTNSEVINLISVEDGFVTEYFQQAELQRIKSRKVLLATGGLSYPATGSTGMGYELASRLGHRIETLLPSLTALVPDNYDTRLVNVLLRNIKASLEIEGNVVQEETGELQFTDGGMEGALGFRLSRRAVKALESKAKVCVVIDLKPALSVRQLEERVIRERNTILSQSPNTKSCDSKLMMDVLRTMLPKSVIPSFIKSNPGISLERLPKRLKSWKFDITGYVGYNRAVVTSGGVSLDEISRKTMESKLVPGLYFAGEVVDLDADTGGYNLQIAFSTAALASRSMIKSLDAE